MPPKRKTQTRPEMVTHPLGTEIYSTEQVAQALGLSVRYILNAIREGRLEARKAGKAYLITREAVRQFWESLPMTQKGKSSVVQSTPPPT
jgi:excisionase family DNA binding protein